MKSRYGVVVMVVVFAMFMGTAFAAEFKGYVKEVDQEKGYLSVRKGKEIVEFECAPGTLNEQVQKNKNVTVRYTDEAGKKKATKITVHGGC